MSTTFDYHPDPCIALHLASVGISSGKGASKVGLTASLRVRPGAGPAHLKEVPIGTQQVLKEVDSQSFVTSKKSQQIFK